MMKEMLTQTEKRKAFFFEKKNQKTFVPCSVCSRDTLLEKIKVFCFFSSEKKTFLSYFAV